MDVRLIWWPAVAMVALTCIVAVYMFRRRVAQMKSERIHPQSLATSRAMLEKMTDSGPADNFRNLFEVPVLFYLGLVVAAQTGQVNALTLSLAWLFVATRIAHSYVHCTSNRVRYRFKAFVAGFFVLIGFWAVLVVGLLK
ncbi:MAG: MAPEG family protein [Rudaea sp.]